MRAAVLHGREDVRVQTVDRPRPAAGEVLLRTQVALTCGTDAKVFRRGYRAGPGAARARPGRARPPDVVIEAVGNPDTAQAALLAVRRGGVVNVFGGCPAGSQIRVDVARLHYEELTLLATFHHTPEAFREALRLIAAGVIDPLTLITKAARLDGLPGVLVAFGRPGSAPKTAILPWGDETLR